uniref:HDC07665 n=1 Tax=Drosophila melanogaster TaxID=7227 RepID=Q6IM27_DROME|nr:TPA_inf: HDC07665 [Drosophila melanogaster]
METAIWSQYQRGGSNPPPFPMPFAMPNMNGESGFGVPYPMMGNSLRYAFKERQDVRRQLEKLLDQKIIRQPFAVECSGLAGA